MWVLGLSRTILILCLVFGGGLYSNTFCLDKSVLSVHDLTLEEKVGQLLMPCFRGLEANEDARVLIQDIKVGGIIYYNWTNDLTSPLQVQSLSEGLQNLTKSKPIPIPLLIAIDQEGGTVARLKGSGFTIFPENRALALTGDPEMARQCAYAIGLELRDVGINMNLAPVVDVNCNPKNPVIGARSFGDNPETVIIFGRSALQGYLQAGVLTTLKHFPGHGDVEVDSHIALPVVNKSKEELERVELAPFKALASSADAVMTAHLLVPAFDPDYCSTLSEKTLQYLRQTIGFKGVIISDSLTMDGVLQQVRGDEAKAAIQALKAGCDILLFGEKRLNHTQGITELTVMDIKNIHQALVNAVKTGYIPEERVNQAVEQVLALKRINQPLGTVPTQRRGDAETLMVPKSILF